MPNPTWGNHLPIFKHSGLEVEKYTYFDKNTNGLNINGMLEDIKVRRTGGVDIDMGGI